MCGAVERTREIKIERITGGESKRKKPRHRQQRGRMRRGEREQGGGEDNPVRARWNENAVTRNKRGGDPKLLVEVQPEGLGMSLRRGGDETLP